MEIWKKIKGFEFYEVSNKGNVRSLDRKIKWAHHGKSGLSNIKGKLLKPIPRVMSKYITYAQVGLHNATEKKTCVKHVHRLVAEAFLPNPENKPQVNHKDGNGLNNKVKNLEWVTEKENSKHARQVLHRKVWHAGALGKNTPTARPVLQITMQGKLVKRWECASDAVRKFGFDSGSITKVCQGKSKFHKNFIWKYADKK